MTSETGTEVDIYRDTALRYLGYSNEVGEAFRSLVKKVFVNATYGIAIGYVLADTADKAGKRHKLPESEGGGTRGALIASGDTLLWQMLASVIVPGFTINRICWGSSKLLKVTKLRGAHPAVKFIPTVVGLASIPLIIHPIDHAIDSLMDNTYRKYVA